MLVSPCVVLDSSMAVSEVVARLARQGYWLDAAHPAVRSVIEESAARLGLPVEEVEQKLARPLAMVGAAIRRQWLANILWYARPLITVMIVCYQAAPDQPLLSALGLHETDSMPVVAVPPAGEAPSLEGVIVDGDTAVAVSLEDWGAGPPEEMSPPVSDHSEALHALSDVGESGELFSLRASRSYDSLAKRARVEATVHEEARPQPVHAWPRIEAPSYVPARKPFDVVVGLAMTQQVGVIGGEVVFRPPSGVQYVDVEVTLIADGLDAPEGWSRTMSVDVNNPAEAEVTFKLVGRDPAGPEPVRLVMLELCYSYGGSVCGRASRPLVIGLAGELNPDLPSVSGTPWLEQQGAGSSVSLKPDPDAADLTIEIFKPDGNSATGNYTCRLYSPHPLSCPMGPFRIELDDDAKGFAKMIVNQVRTYANSPVVDNLLVSHGKLIADKLGRGVINALREVADRVKPATPAVLLVSAEPYVPWELAYIDPPLDANRPGYLGAQAMVGRWLRPRGGPQSPSLGGTTAGTMEKPPVQPPSRVEVKHMAVMAGMYRADTGLRQLPEAEAEAKALQKAYDAVPLAASLQAVKQLLDARLEHNFESIGGVEAIHFAGHGDYDATTPDSAVLYLSDGMPLFASLFGSAQYGGEQSPVFFLNACMSGIGDELLGDMGGFPGNCLKGGFAGVLGALWEVDDKMARKLAMEFWQRALPLNGGKAEPVGAILRDLRAQYVPDPAKVPATTSLAYVYYGHPRLRLQMA